EISEARTKAMEIASVASVAIVIHTADDYRAAGEQLTRIKHAAKQLEELRLSLTRPLDESKKRIMAMFARPKDDLDGAEAKLKRAMLAYNTEQDRIRREAEARLRAEAEAEEKRQEAQRKAALDAALESGDAAKAEEIINTPAVPPPPVAVVPQAIPPKVAGVSTRKIWTWKITDPDLIPRDYLLVNESMLTAVAKSGKGAVKVPGVEFYQVESIAAGGR
ncbi:MAG: hypothetical protein OEY50_05720, partial [Nitrospinota bacterium]|nr:hypothetical protein [Nitrospinota bacterium]